MALNVGAARTQAGQLNNNVVQLRDAKNKLKSYRMVISNNWSGMEVAYILAAIDETISDIEKSIRDIEALSHDIKNVAEQIKREEEAAAAAAAVAARQQRIKEAQRDYDDACDELNELNKRKELLVKKMAKVSYRDRYKIGKDLLELEAKIHRAEEKCEIKLNALKAAKR